MLKHSSGYTLKKVGNSWYLLPFGQQVADQHKAVVLNETGAFLWNTLEHTSDLEELTHHLARYYEVPESTWSGASGGCADLFPAASLLWDSRGKPGSEAPGRYA